MADDTQYPESQVQKMKQAIDTLEEALKQQPASSGWRSIESAPKDGTDLWGYLSSGQQVCIYCNDNGYWCASISPGFKVNPTHWQPLPQPPQHIACEKQGQQQPIGCEGVMEEIERMLRVTDEHSEYGLTEHERGWKNALLLLRYNLLSKTTTTEEEGTYSVTGSVESIDFNQEQESQQEEVVDFDSWTEEDEQHFGDMFGAFDDSRGYVPLRERRNNGTGREES